MRLVIRDPGFGADHVELFISTRNADTNAIGPDRARADEERSKLRGDGFFLDGPGDAITPLTRLEVSGDRVVWDLRADGEHPAKIKLLVAVAFDANNTAVGIAKMYDFEVPVNDTIATVLVLEEATQVPPSDAAQPPGVRVWPWRKADASAAACLGIEFSDGRDVKERTWLVPENDPDCDDFEIECDKHLHHADYSSLAETCVVPSVVGSANTIPCMLGSKSCEDGVNAGVCSARTAPRYCLANAFCEPDACIQNPEQCQQLDTSLVSCSLSLEQDGKRCGVSTTAMGPLTIMLSSITSPGMFPGGCQGVAFASNMSTNVTPTPSITVAGATFSIQSFDPTTCSFSIEMNGQYDTAVGSQILFALDITRPNHHLVVPVFVQLHPGECDGDPPSCEVSRATVSELDGCP